MRILAGGGFTYVSVTDTGAITTANMASSGIRVPVRAQTVTQTASAAGTVMSSDVVTANFTASGMVTAIYVKLGQAVTKARNSRGSTQPRRTRAHDGEGQSHRGR